MGLSTESRVFQSWLHLLVFDEGVFIDGFCHVPEEDFGGQGVAMVHHWLPIWAIPAIHWQDQKSPTLRDAPNLIHSCAAAASRAHLLSYGGSLHLSSHLLPLQLSSH